MSQILLITSSPRAEASYSTRVAHALAKNLISKHRDSTLIVRDLAGDPPLHIDGSFAAARNTPHEHLLPSQRDVLALSDALVSELMASDIIIMAARMINFGIPSTLKSYIDHILRPGATFRYTEKGPEGWAGSASCWVSILWSGSFC
jgi:FMN-dependent NADH-azoreductase